MLFILATASCVFFVYGLVSSTPLEVGFSLTTIGCACFLLPCKMHIFFKLGAVVSWSLLVERWQKDQDGLQVMGEMPKFQRLETQKGLTFVHLLPQGCCFLFVGSRQRQPLKKQHHIETY